MNHGAITAPSVTDLASRVATPAFRRLLLTLVGWRDDDTANHEAVERAILAYQHEPQCRVLGVESDGDVWALLGLELQTTDHAVIRHLVVRADMRSRGFGRAVIADARNRFKLSSLTAETHKDAVAFYEKCGFAVTSLGEKYVGVERFACVWRV